MRNPLSGLQRIILRQCMSVEWTRRRLVQVAWAVKVRPSFLMTPVVPRPTGQLVRFVVVGAIGMVVNSASLSFLYRLAHVALPISSGISTEVAIASNFLLDDLWTFAQARISLTRFLKFNLTALAGLVITVVTVWFLVERLGVHYLLANLLAVSGSGVFNYVLSITWIWGTRRP